jgi:hypothetical protein
VCHKSLLDRKFYEFLDCIDQDLADQTQAGRCRRCHNALHKNRYPRKPRGIPHGAGFEIDKFRLSLKCSRCVKRHTPPSVRWLGRKIYLGAVVVLASALRAGLTDQRVTHLVKCVKISRRTIERWRAWWLRDVADTAFWKNARARLMPPVAVSALPVSLLARFAGPDLPSQLVQVLRFLAPLSEGG